MTTRGISQRIAEHVGDAGFYGVAYCTHCGDSNIDDDDQPIRSADEACYNCGEKLDRGEPKPYARDLALVTDTARKWLWEHHDDHGQISLIWSDDTEDPIWRAEIRVRGLDYGTGYDCELAPALATALLAAMEREEAQHERTDHV